jgi:lipid-binding SYLF domain-containing protein
MLKMLNNENDMNVKKRRDTMKLRLIIYLTSILCLTLVAGAVALAQGKNLKEGAEQAQKAATVLEEIMSVPDKAIPNKILDGAECVAVFPQVIKGGFIIGARGGRGVASCRTSRGWSEPAYFEMKGGSFGLQIGAQATDFILLFMNPKAMESLLKSKFTIGGDVSVAAGPVGRAATAETDALMNAQILSYSRSKGVFAGLELKGTAISPEKGTIEDVYGKGVTAEDVVKTGKAKAPAEVKIFPNTLAKFSARKA